MSEMNATSAGLQHHALGREIVGRINELAAISETPEHLTRIFLTKEHRAAADLVLGWMRDAGMRAHLDAIGNVCGRYEGEVAGSPCLMLGSHYDTVRDAGKWDGPLGLGTAIAVRDRGDRVRRRGGGPVRVHAVGEPCGRGNVRRECAWRKGQRRNFVARCAFAIRPRPRSYRSGGEGPQRIARLPRTPH